MPIEPAQTHLNFAVEQDGSIDIWCLSGAPRRNLVHLVSHGLACTHDIANLPPNTANAAHYQEQNHEY